jgi:chromosome segregation ATPase
LQELEATKIELDRSQTERESIDNKLTNTIWECDKLGNELTASVKAADTLNTVKNLLGVDPGEVVEAIAQLKAARRQKVSLLRWPHTRKSIDWKTRAVAAEALLAVYTAADYPAQVRAAQNQTEEARRHIAYLDRRVLVSETTLELTRPETGRVQMLERVVSTNKDRIKDLEHELKAMCLPISQLKEENTTLLAQLGLARTKAESAQQAFRDRIEPTRLNGGTTEQALLDRLATALLKRLEPTGSESVL